MGKSPTTVKSLAEHPDMKPAQKGWKKTMQVQSDGSVRIIATKVPSDSK